MLCVVYVLRRGGQKLPPEILKSRPYVGWLYLGRDTRKVEPQQVIRLFQSSKALIDVVEPMIDPHVKSIERGGMLFVGSEELRDGVTQKQAWWVLPGPLDDLSTPP